MKKYSTDIFAFLNWILKKNNTPLPENCPSPFIINRWLSMADPSVAYVINLTFNKWLYKTDLIKESNLIYKFYKCLLPRFNKRIFYLKKTTAEKEDVENLSELAISMEISQRELLQYSSTLEVLNSNVKL